MAELSCDGLDGLMLSMKEIEDIPDDVKDEILNVQADIVVAAQKEQGKAYGVVDTGLMISSIKKTKPRKTSGGKTIHVYPQGSRTRGKTKTSNAEIAFITEYGKKGCSPHPFIRDANEQSAEATTQAALSVYNDWLKSKKL